MSRTNAANQQKKKKAFANQDLPGLELHASAEDMEREKDFYPTPKHALDSIVPKLTVDLRVWEPCCGDRRLINWLSQYGFMADGADLRDDPPADFLKDETVRECILTNPPFSLAQEFVDWARSHAKEVFMLLPLGFLGTQKRAEWWKVNEPQALFVLSKRPSFTGGPTDSAEYAWFYWGARHTGIFHV